MYLVGGRAIFRINRGSTYQVPNEWFALAASIFRAIEAKLDRMALNANQRQALRDRTSRFQN
jgi:hypothetical protein